MANAITTTRARQRGFELSLIPGRSGAWQIFLSFAGAGKGRYRHFWFGPLCITVNGSWFKGYPPPDRSGVPRNFVRRAADDAIDLAWCEGHLQDGRAYVAELWSRGEVTCITVFFSQLSLKRLTDRTAAEQLERAELVKFRRRYCSVRPFVDASGHRLWSVNVVAGDANEAFIENTFPFQPYPDADLLATMASRTLN